MNYNNNNNMQHSGDGNGMMDNGSSKRHAQAGQWKTPPVQMFTGMSHQHPLAPAPSNMGPPQRTMSTDDLPGLPPPTNVPNTSEDYAKALQEAYRKGAEAAARMAHQQQHQLPSMASVTSCPDFHQPQSQISMIAPAHPSTGSFQAEQNAYRASLPTHSSQASMNSNSSLQQSIPDPLRNLPSPTPVSSSSVVGMPMYASPALSAAPHNNNGAAAMSIDATRPPRDPSSKPPPSASSAAVGRSVSMPDMTAYAAQAEEEKRQKRLARNRASARLRRLRKKNLVDAYETEVGVLEKTLKKLKAHEWGKDDNHKALLEALGMERGQQFIPKEQRGDMIRDILKQQMQHVEFLREAQMEQECLALIAEDPTHELAQELQQILQLNEHQIEQIRHSSSDLPQQIEAAETVISSLQALLENDWLLNEGIENITEQFTSILHKNQLSKFLLWADANVEAIDQLDYVQVRPLENAPIFTFGVEASATDDDDKH